MTTIRLYTLIQADITTCFDLSTDIDLHQRSMASSNEKAIAGKTSGLCTFNDEITWEATHFMIRQRLSSRITGFERPVFFEDTMIKGAFKSMEHQHYFEVQQEGYTLMTDIFRYEVPYGILGRLFNGIVLKKYMTRLLETRNQTIKAAAEQSAL